MRGLPRLLSLIVGLTIGGNARCQVDVPVESILERAGVTRESSREILKEYNETLASIQNAVNAVERWTDSVQLDVFGVDDSDYRGWTLGARTRAAELAEIEARRAQTSLLAELRESGLSAEVMDGIAREFRMRRVLDGRSMRALSLLSESQYWPPRHTRYLLVDLLHQARPDWQDTPAIVAAMNEYAATVAPVIDELDAVMANHHDTLSGERRRIMADIRGGNQSPEGLTAFFRMYLRPYMLLLKVHDLQRRTLQVLRNEVEASAWSRMCNRAYVNLFSGFPSAPNVRVALETAEQSGAGHADAVLQLRELFQEATAADAAALQVLGPQFDAVMNEEVIQAVAEAYISGNHEGYRIIDDRIAQFTDAAAPWENRLRTIEARRRELVEMLKDIDGVPAAPADGTPGGIMPPERGPVRDTVWPLTVTAELFQQILTDASIASPDSRAILTRAFEDYTNAVSSAAESHGQIDSSSSDEFIRRQRQMRKVAGELFTRLLADGVAVLHEPDRSRWVEAMAAARRRLACDELSELTLVRVIPEIEVFLAPEIAAEARVRTILQQHRKHIDDVAQTWFDESARLLYPPLVNVADGNADRVAELLTTLAAVVGSQSDCLRALTEAIPSGASDDSTLALKRAQLPGLFVASPGEALLDYEVPASVLAIVDEFISDDSALRERIGDEIDRMHRSGRGVETDAVVRLIKQRSERTFGVARRIRRSIDSDTWSAIPAAARVLIGSMLVER